ncbi:MAG TPA: patatin-like phospholipase family protein [Fimbriiglobus sp.]|nr:patatin-like phospholipase family protein [Fimbriiglobus sp.]
MRVTGARLALLACLLGACPGPGCGYRRSAPYPTPAASGLNTRDLIDPVAQPAADSAVTTNELATLARQLQTFRSLTDEEQRKVAEFIRNERAKAAPGAEPRKPPKNVLCLSGGGSFGAYSAGVLVGWTERGDRPCFDVVTGISTGALIAPFAFLGPKYDADMQRFYTTLTTRDIYRLTPIRGLFGESFTDSAPLARQINQVLTEETIQEVADAHRAGRRLYIGTTETEGKRFIVWDIGAIACRNGPGDRELIKRVLLGSAAAPGVFPPAKIVVSVDGVRHTERHVDGGVSQAIFVRPPYFDPSVPPEQAIREMVGTNVYAIVAGKLYADAEVIKPKALTQAAKSVSTIIYAQTRGDLQRMYTLCLVRGMNYNLSAIPAEYPAPISSSEFKPEVMGPMFKEGRRWVLGCPDPWRHTPPGTEFGEAVQVRTGPCLTYQQRGPILPISGPRGRSVQPRYPVSDPIPIPAVPGATLK